MGAKNLSDYLVEQAEEMDRIYRNGDLIESDFFRFLVSVRLCAGYISNVLADLDTLEDTTKDQLS